MRLATLLLCLSLAGCATGGQSAPEAAAPASSMVASSPTARSPGSAGGARGGAVTAAARGGEPVDAGPDALTQARADCWMKVESQKALRSIDQRIAFIDKCVADQMKARP